MSTSLLTNAQVLCLGQPDKIIDHGYVLIEDQYIIAVGKQSNLPSQHVDHIIDASGKLIMPGLVNAHTHTPMVLFRGLAEGVSLLTMDGWYNTIRTLEMVMTPDMVPAAVTMACAEMIRTGTTTFADQYFFMNEVIPAVRGSGLRAGLAYGVVELGDPVARAHELANLDAFLEEINSQHNSRLKGWVGPHAFFVDNSIETMQTERMLAQKYGTGLHIHFSTTSEEDIHCIERYGISAAQKMVEMGMLERPIIAAHSITIPAEDWPILAAKPFSIAACPSACMRAGAEAAPVVGMRTAGINVALGTDNVCNNNDYDLFLEMRLLAKLASFREKRPGALAAREVLDIATAGGARALGLADEIGELAPGKRADLIMLDKTGIGWAPMHGNDPFTPLVYSISGLHVTDTMVDGAWLLRNRQWTTIDYARAVDRVNKDVGRLLDLRQSTMGAR